MTDLRPDLTTLPARFAKLPTARGYPVPWFVAWVDDKPEFRIADGRKRVRAVNERLCWVCGQRLGSFIVFLVGPMCAVNRISSDPGMHRECAEWSAINCPFLTRPHMVRREGGLPEEATSDGMMIERNPGVMLMWVTKSFTPFNTGDGGWLIRLGDPVEWHAYREKRLATPEELFEGIRSGLPLLLEPAKQEGDRAVRSLRKGVERAMHTLNLQSFGMMELVP